MTGVLIIGPNEERAINEAVERARAKPLPWELIKPIVDRSGSDTLMMKDRKPGIDVLRQEYPPQNVMLGTYRAAVSFEYQPAGLMRHLSVSSAHRGKVPGPEVMRMIAEAFGFSGMPPRRPHRMWMEEFEPERMAINIAEVEP